jgi:coenzyme F420 hydrogenase subunit beta
MHRARLRAPRAGAQWTGLTTRLAECLLERGMVDAVIADGCGPRRPVGAAPRPGDRSGRAWRSAAA